jgi:hypothetical protein
MTASVYPIGAAMAGGNPRRSRQKDDWYPTPPEVTVALLDSEAFDGPIWEPCCGDGSMATVIASRGYHVVSSDLVDRGFTELHGADFDVLRIGRLLAPNIVTNPPFVLAPKVISHLLSLEPDSLALLLKSTFWHARSRSALFERHPPAVIHALTWRPDFLGYGGPTMEAVWCVWRRGHRSGTTYKLLHRPADFPIRRVSRKGLGKET